MQPFLQVAHIDKICDNKSIKFGRSVMGFLSEYNSKLTSAETAVK